MRRVVILLQWRDLKIYGRMSRISSRRLGVRRMEVRFRRELWEDLRVLRLIVFLVAMSNEYVCMLL
jgi:hypothetical protein